MSDLLQKKVLVSGATATPRVVPIRLNFAMKNLVKIGVKFLILKPLE
jgi:hypothetical protein